MKRIVTAIAGIVVLAGLTGCGATTNHAIEEALASGACVQDPEACEGLPVEFGAAGWKADCAHDRTTCGAPDPKFSDEEIIQHLELKPKEWTGWYYKTCEVDTILNTPAQINTYVDHEVVAMNPAQTVGVVVTYTGSDFNQETCHRIFTKKLLDFPAVPAA